MAERELHLAYPDQRVARSYVQTISIFPFPDAQYSEAAVNALEEGLHATLTSFPYLAGMLGPEDKDGKLKLRYPENITRAHVRTILRAEKLDDEQYNYTELEAANMPTSTFQGTIFAPLSLRERRDLPRDVEGIISFRNLVAPVLGVGAIFIQGGLCISTYTHHSVLDGTGRSNFLKQFARDVNSLSKIDRVDSPLRLSLDEPLWDEAEARLQIDARVPPLLPGQEPPTAEVYGNGILEYKSTLPDDTPCSGKIFTVAASKIRAFRDSLIADGVQTERKISVFNVLAALVWIHITRARYDHLGEYRNGDSSIAIAVDLRKRMKPPVDLKYMGNLALGTKATMPVPALVKEERVTKRTIVPTVQAIAHSIAKIDSDPSWIDRQCQFLNQGGPITSTELHMKHRFGPDLYMTSWLNQQIYEDWNIPGTPSPKPTFFRRAHSEIDGGVVFMPRRVLPDTRFEDAPYEILVRIAAQDMKRLINEDDGLVSWCIGPPT